MDCGKNGLTFTQPSLCKPQFAAECDLGTIVKRFLRTGELPQFKQRQTIDDATNAPSGFFEALQPAVEVQQAFDQLPLEERNKFNNDAQAWFEESVENEAGQREDAGGVSEAQSADDSEKKEKRDSSERQNSEVE